MKPLSSTRGYLGGGLIAAVLGISPFLTPLDAYLQITGEREEQITAEKREFFDDRRDLEPWAAKKFTRKTGLQILRTNHRYDDAEFSWAKAEIDAETETGANVETKTVRPGNYKDWGNPEHGEECPRYVAAQAMWGLGVTGRSLCYVNALIGFDEHRVYEIHWDVEIIEAIRAKAAHFWKHHIEPRRMPAPTTADDLAWLYPRSRDRTIEANDDVRADLEILHRVRGRQRVLDNEREAIELRIKSYMKDASSLTVRNITVATWKSSKAGIRSFLLK